jgi:ribosomal protein S18 acetylase RimI-like enzyme
VIESIDITLQPEALRVLELQRVSYQIEADLIGLSLIPPLRESFEALQSCGEVFHGWFEAGRLLGFISHKLEDGTVGNQYVDIHRVAVHPNGFRRGIAKQLLEFVLNLEPSATRAIVQTGSLNVPACKLYLSFGFEILERKEVAPGLELTLFSKTLRVTT